MDGVVVGVGVTLGVVLGEGVGVEGVTQIIRPMKASSLPPLKPGWQGLAVGKSNEFVRPAD